MPADRTMVSGTACLLILVLLLNSCSALIPSPGELDLSALPSEFSHYTVRELRAGRDAYVTHCGACHRLFLPQEKTAAEWLGTYGLMKEKTRLTGQDEEKLIVYLRTFAKSVSSSDSTR